MGQTAPTTFDDDVVSLPLQLKTSGISIKNVLSHLFLATKKISRIRKNICDVKLNFVFLIHIFIIFLHVIASNSTKMNS